MKRRTSFRLLALTMLIALVSACSEPVAKYTNVIPADASTIVSLHLSALGSKAGAADKENKEALQQLTDVLKNEMNAAAFQQLEGVLNNPAKSGIDLEAPIYLFQSANFEAAIVAKVNSEDDLQALLSAAEKEQISTPVAEGDGYRYTTLGEQALLAFTPEALLVVGYHNPAQLEEAKANAAAALHQGEEQSMSANEGFKKMQAAKGDVNMYLPLKGMLKDYANLVNQNVPEDIDWKELVMLGALSFENGKIDWEIEWYTENEALAAQLKEQGQATTSPIQNTYLKNLPQSTLMVISAGLNGEEIMKYLQENKDFQKSITVDQLNKLKTLIGAFKNDATAGITNVSLMGMPSFIMYAEAQNSDALKALYEEKEELGLGRGEDIVQLGENEYVFKSRKLNVFFGIKDNTLYATNDEQAYKNIGKPVSPSAADTDYAAEIKGENAAVIINVDAIRQLPAVQMLAQYGGKEITVYLNLAEKISYLKMTGNAEKSNITLQLKDKNVNSLKQIVELIKQYAGI